MPSELMKQAKTHLEFLGYTFTSIKGETNELKVTHPEGFTFSFFASEYVVKFAACFATKKVEHPGCLKFINSLNLGSRLVSFCKNDFNTLVCQGVFYGAYTKPSFSFFLRSWDYDMDIVFRERVEECRTYIE